MTASLRTQRSLPHHPSPRCLTAAVEAHDGAVVGLAADSSNRLLVSASLDGHLRIWRFKALTQQADVALGAPATHLAMHPGSALAAVALDSRQVVMYDVEAARLVRRFKGHGDRITALSISEDSRWVQRLGCGGCSGAGGEC